MLKPVLDAFKKFRHYEDKLQDMTKGGAKTENRDVYERNIEKRDNAEELWAGIKEEVLPHSAAERHYCTQ